MTDTRRPPVVTHSDRQWALSQQPVWAVRGRSPEPQFPEIADDDADTPASATASPTVLVWDDYVDDQIRRFEKHYGDKRRAAGDWSELWRKSWWPKSDPKISHPHLVPRSVTASAYRVYRVGDGDFARAIAVGTPSEQRLWRRLGVVQFPANDPRVKRIEGTSPVGPITDRIVGGPP